MKIGFLNTLARAMKFILRSVSLRQTHKGSFKQFWWALGYFVAFPFMFVLAWNFMRMFQKFMGSCRFVARKNRAKVSALKELRNSIFSRLDKIIG